MSKRASYLRLRGLLGINGCLFAHSSEDNDISVLVFLGEELGDFIADLTLRKLDIILGGAIIRHEGEKTVISNIEELVFLATDVGDVHVMGGRAKIFQLLAGEDVNGDEMDLGVTMFSGLRSRHLNNLAGAVLDDDESVLPQSRALHGVGGRGTGIGALEGVLMLRIVSVGHGDKGVSVWSD